MYVDPRLRRAGIPEALWRASTTNCWMSCTGLGISLTQMLTDEPLERVLFHWLAHQMRQTGGGAMWRRTLGGGGQRR